MALLEQAVTLVEQGREQAHHYSHRLWSQLILDLCNELESVEQQIERVKRAIDYSIILESDEPDFSYETRLRALRSTLRMILEDE